MLDEFALPAARDVATTKPQAVVFGCTSGGALRGNAYDQQLCEDISRISRVPTVSTIASVRRAIGTSGAKRIAIITPYIEDLTQRVRASIEADGTKVIATHSMGIIDNTEIGRMTPQEIVSFAQDNLKHSDADLLFASCTNWRAMEAIPLLKQLFNMPVISSNQVVLEAALRTLGVHS
jgi:maleate isomerase